MDSLWHNRRIQRVAIFALVFVTFVAFALWGSDRLPDASTLNLEGVGKYVAPESGREPQPNATTTPEEPLYDVKQPEYDPARMPDIPPPPKAEATPAAAVATPVTLDPKRIGFFLETRPNPVIPALLTHFAAVLPPQWIVKTVGTKEVLDLIDSSPLLKAYKKTGKMVTELLPAHFIVTTQETVSQTLTDLKFYETLVAPAEWALFFQTDSMICAASDLTVDDWVAKGYDWVGAPWHENVKGGNGGLSLRHIPSIVKLLKNVTREENGGGQWEDLWLSERLENAAIGAEETQFSVESIWHERPLGYHIRGSGKLPDAKIWGNATRRRHIMEYCPEVKIVLGNMKMQSPDDDKQRQKEEKELKEFLEKEASKEASAVGKVASQNATAVAQPTKTPEVGAEGGAKSAAPAEKSPGSPGATPIAEAISAAFEGVKEAVANPDPVSPVEPVSPAQPVA